MKEEFWNEVESMEGWCPKVKAEDIHAVVLESKPSLCVEIGVFGGRSLVVIADALRENHHGIVYGIDPWEAQPCVEGDNDAANDDWWSKLDFKTIHEGFVRWVVKLELLQQCRWLHMTDTQALKMFDDQSIGFLHIDGNHSEKVGMRNFNQWSPMIEPGGHMVIDDTNWPTQQKLVQTIVNDDRFELVKDAGNYMIFRRK